jgi:hypothetical protein
MTDGSFFLFTQFTHTITQTQRKNNHITSHHHITTQHTCQHPKNNSQGTETRRQRVGRHMPLVHRHQKQTRPYDFVHSPRQVPVERLRHEVHHAWKNGVRGACVQKCEAQAQRYNVDSGECVLIKCGIYYLSLQERVRSNQP